MSRVPQATLSNRKLPQTAVSPRLLTSEEVAPHLRKTVRTIRRLAARGKLKGAFKIGRDWRFHPAILNNGEAKA
jgi:excisionase family DNA binding protein